MPNQPFEQKLSRQLDNATAALEEAGERGDEVRAEYARAWKRRLEDEIFGGEDDQSEFSD